MSIIQNAVKTSVFFLSAYKKYYTVKQSFKQNPPDFPLQYIIYCVHLQQSWAFTTIFATTRPCCEAKKQSIVTLSLIFRILNIVECYINCTVYSVHNTQQNSNSKLFRLLSFQKGQKSPNIALAITLMIYNKKRKLCDIKKQ